MIVEGFFFRVCLWLGGNCKLGVLKIISIGYSKEYGV